MSKSDADTRRREQGKAIKVIHKEEIIIEETPRDGCPYYGNLELMSFFCIRCKREECY
jgi:hypothetical protein